MMFVGLAVTSLALSGLALAVGCGTSAGTNAAGSGNDGGLLFVDEAGISGIWEDGSFVATAADGGFCSGSGPIVVVGDSEGGTTTSQCTGQIAEEIFKSALCTCQDVNLQGYLRTRGFSSASGAVDAGTNGAPVGINGNYVIPALAVNAGFTDVGGSFAVAGADSLAFAGDFTVNGDFHAASSLTLAGYTPIAGSAWTARAGALAAWPGLTALNVRDLGRVLTAGPIREAFDGAASGDLMQLAPALGWAGIPDYETRYYAGLVYLGGILIIAQIPDQIAAELLERSWNGLGAREVSYHIADENLEPQASA